MRYAIAILLFASVAHAQTAPIDIPFSWQSNGKNVTGFRLYKGTSPATFIKAADIVGATVRTYNFKSTEMLPICFGLSAYGAGGESAIVTKDNNGVDVCVGKPDSPSSFSFSAPSNP